jgi:hypothetical protein
VIDKELSSAIAIRRSEQSFEGVICWAECLSRPSRYENRPARGTRSAKAGIAKHLVDNSRVLIIADHHAEDELGSQNPLTNSSLDAHPVEKRDIGPLSDIGEWSIELISQHEAGATIRGGEDGAVFGIEGVNELGHSYLRRVSLEQEPPRFEAVGIAVRWSCTCPSA